MKIYRLLVVLVFLLLVIPYVFADDWQTDRMNFPPGESRLHNQTVYTSSSVLVSIPPGLTITEIENGKGRGWFVYIC